LRLSPGTKMAVTLSPKSVMSGPLVLNEDDEESKVNL
jgi:hypothetical protein